MFRFNLVLKFWKQIISHDDTGDDFVKTMAPYGENKEKSFDNNVASRRPKDKKIRTRKQRNT
jgi:hypothetical protein